MASKTITAAKTGPRIPVRKLSKLSDNLTKKSYLQNLKKLVRSSARWHKRQQTTQGETRGVGESTV